MNKTYRIFFVLCLYCLVPTYVASQINDVGAITSLGISKDFGKNSSIKLEQDFRFDQNLSSFNRAKTTVGLNYSLFRKLLIAEFDYNFMYLKSNDIYEYRHRLSVGLSTESGINRFDLGFRTKVQSTWRDELRGSYNFNPKYVWRNKFGLDYDILGLPLKRLSSVEIFCPLNGSRGCYLDGYRTAIGVKYKLSKHHAVEFNLQYDQEVQQANPRGIIYAVAGWSYKL